MGQQENSWPQEVAEDDWLPAEGEEPISVSLRSGGGPRSQGSEPPQWDSIIDEASQESFPASDPPASTHCTVT